MVVLFLTPYQGLTKPISAYIHPSALLTSLFRCEYGYVSVQPRVSLFYPLVHLNTCSEQNRRIVFCRRMRMRGLRTRVYMRAPPRSGITSIVEDDMEDRQRQLARRFWNHEMPERILWWHSGHRITALKSRRGR